MRLIAGVMALNYAIATPNFVIQEKMTGAVLWDGEVDGAVAARHPFHPEVVYTRHAVLADGTIIDW